MKNIGELKVTDHAKTAQLEIRDYLISKGYECKLEHKVKDRGDGRAGKIDILAEKGLEKWAIEVDWNKPRKKSLTKLKSMDGFHKIVLLRTGSLKYKEDGIIILSLGLKSWAKVREDGVKILRRTESPDNYIWTSNSGKINLWDMNSRHILNTINLLYSDQFSINNDFKNKVNAEKVDEPGKSVTSGEFILIMIDELKFRGVKTPIVSTSSLLSL